MAPRRRRSLAGLFAGLTVAFAAVAVASAWGAGGSAGRWVVTAASGVIAAWFATLAWQSR